MTAKTKSNPANTLIIVLFTIALIGLTGFGCDTSNPKLEEETPVAQDQNDGETNTPESGDNPPVQGDEAAPEPQPDTETADSQPPVDTTPPDTPPHDELPPPDTAPEAPANDPDGNENIPDPSGNGTANNNDVPEIPAESSTESPAAPAENPPEPEPTPSDTPASPAEDTHPASEVPADNLSGNEDIPDSSGNGTAGNDTQPPAQDDVTSDTPAVRNAKFKISVKTDSNADIEQIRLDITEVRVCGAGGCQTAGTAKRIDLLDESVNAVDLFDGLMPEGNITQLRFILGSDNTVVVNGESHQLTVPSGDASGLKLAFRGNLKPGELNQVLVDFDPENAVRETSDGYALDPVIKIADQITVPETADTAVVDPAKGGKLRKAGKFELDIPAGAVDSPVILYEVESEVDGLSSVYTLGPDGTQFSQPITVRLAYNPDALCEGATVDNLVILHNQEAVSTIVDTENNLLIGEIAHFSNVQAGTQGAPCGGEDDSCPCGADNTFLCCSNGGNGTWWVWDKVCCIWGEEPASDINGWSRPRHAYNWDDRASERPAIYTVNNTPAPNSIAVINSYGEWGHVAWVESVNGGQITVSEMMCGGFPGYRYQTYNISDFDAFIHYNGMDTGLSAPELRSPSDGASDVSTTPDLDWYDVDGATVYRIFVADSRSTLSALGDDDRTCANCLVNTTTTSSDHSMELEDGTYYWMVRAGNATAGSPNSVIWSFSISSDPGPEPTPDQDPEPTPDPDPEPTPEPWECDEREALWDEWEIHASGTGPDFTHTWGLVNNTSCPMEDFTIGNPDVYVFNGVGHDPYSADISGTYSEFSLEPNGGRGEVTADFNFSLPDDNIYRIYFDIITNTGERLPYLNDTPPGFGRLFSDVGTPIGGCFGPEPTIDYVDHVNMGAGAVNLKAEVQNAIDAVCSTNGGPQQTMETSGEGYASQLESEQGENDFNVTITGECDTQAFIDYMARTNYSQYFGSYACHTDCNGYQKCGADPVNSAIGNFFHQENDAVVAGLGGTDIVMRRTYNSQAAMWTPASMRRYYPDGSEEVVAEPPQYFGKGWTSVLGEFLLVIDMAPVFEGVQILYADGHTGNFKKDGDQYVSDSTGNHDVVMKEGDEYVLYKTGCSCSLESKRFNADGKLAAISDKNGNEIRLIYAGDLLAAVENASGRRIEFELDGEGRITRASLPEGISLSYEYSDELLTAFVNGRGLRTQYRYDGEGQMTEIVSPKGHPLVRNTYDDEYRVSEQTVGETEKYTFEYQDGLTRVANAYGNATEHHYDEDLRLVQIDHPDGNSEYYEYDGDNNRVYYMDQGGAEWRWTYDENGNRLTADGPLGWHREWTYNDKNQVTRMAENVDAATVRTTTFEYDERGNLLRFCNPLGDCGSVVYDSLGQPLEMTDFAGNTTAHVFDSEGDLVTVTDAESAATSFDHDGLGRVVGMVRPLGNAYTYIYDENSNMTDVNGPLGFHIGFAFDENGNLASKTDPNAGNIDYSYNASDRIVGIVNQLRFDTATYAYGLMNEVAGVTDAEGRTWNYEYDEMLRVSDVNGPLGVHFGYAYSAVGKITDFTDANGIVTHTEYDALYRPLSVVRNFLPVAAPNADTNVTVAYEWNLVGQMLRTVDPEGFATQFVYDLAGRRTGKTDAEGHDWSYEYDPMGNLLRMLNPRGFASQFEYTPTYRIRSAVNPENHAVGYQYDANGNLTQITDPKTVVTRFEYDELDRRVGKTRNYLPGQSPDSETNVAVQYAYDLAGNLRRLTNPRSYEAEFVYDAAHRRTDIIDFEQGRTRFAYDRVNNMLTVTDANGNATNYEYDDLNRLVEILNAENEAKSFQYDPMGNRTHLVEADGTVTLYGYDAIYRLNQVTQNYRNGLPSNNDTNVATNYAYDARGLLLEILNANGAATAFDYNAVGRMVRETDPLNNVWTYAYDGVGNRTSRVDANGDRTEYAYYPDDMLEEIRYANGQAVSYVYDPNNNRTRMTDWLGQTDWDYDPLNRVVRADDPFSRVLAYGYDAASNRTEMTYPDGNRVGYGFSPNNWMADVTDPENGQTAYTRDRVGNILHIANPNNTETETTYDRVYRTLTHVNRQTTGGQKLHTAFDYTYNVLGHVTQVVKEYGWRNPPEITETYEYDGLHRLSGAVIDPLKNNGDPVSMTYAYDPVGNRLSWQSNDNLTTQEPFDGFANTYSYNAANQLLSVLHDADKKNPNDNYRTDYAYDGNGNRINKLRSDSNGPLYGVDYTFDPENRLIQNLDYQLVGHDNTNRIDRAVTDLEYDGGGRRLVKHYDPKSNAAQGVDKRVEYVFDGLDPVAEYEMLNGQRENFYRGAMGRIITKHHFNSGARGQMYWYHYNFKGDVAGLTKHNGNSHHTYRYDPYGGVVPENGNFTDPHNHYTLTGKEYDENMGLVWFGARHYDFVIARWITQDLYRGRVSNPMSLNRYSYIEGSPPNYIDWLGYATINYNKEQAVKYATENYNRTYGYDEGQNPFYNFEKIGHYNCTNFVSQALLAGLSDSSSPETVYDKRKEYEDTDGFSWYYRKLSDRTSSWSGANDLYKYVINQIDTEENCNDENKLKGWNFDFVTKDSPTEFMDYTKIQVGDIIFVDFPEKKIVEDGKEIYVPHPDGDILPDPENPKPNHTMIVTDIDTWRFGYNEIQVTFQTENKKDMRLGVINEKYNYKALFYVYRPISFETDDD